MCHHMAVLFVIFTSGNHLNWLHPTCRVTHRVTTNVYCIGICYDPILSKRLLHTPNLLQCGQVSDATSGCIGATQQSRQRSLLQTLPWPQIPLQGQKPQKLDNDYMSLYCDQIMSHHWQQQSWSCSTWTMIPLQVTFDHWSKPKSDCVHTVLQVPFSKNLMHPKICQCGVTCINLWWDLARRFQLKQTQVDHLLPENHCGWSRSVAKTCHLQSNVNTLHQL